MNTKPAKTFADSKLHELCVNSIRFLSVDAIEKANSGHPGLPMGAAPMAYVLWTRFLKHNPANPAWWDRDRFVLSAGHGSMLLYSLLYLTGYDLSLEQLKLFRQLGSKTPGHPERHLALGIETTTGPLGQGFANGIGMAIAESYLAARYNRPGCDIFGHYTYSIVSDGDLMEGISSEAASLAGHLKLGKLICLYDDNRISLAATTNVTFTEDRAKRFEACGWQTLIVEDGNDLESIERSLLAAQAENGRPTLISVRTQLGFGSPHKQGSYEAHGSPLGTEETELTKRTLGWPVDQPFYVPDEALRHFRQARDSGKKAEEEWNAKFAEYSRQFPDLAQELQQLMRGQLPPGWDASFPEFPPDAKGMATRSALGKVMNAKGPNVTALIGGSADLNPSTRTVLQGKGDFADPRPISKDMQGLSGGELSYRGQNIHFGVREHAMGAIANGMAAHGGTIPFTATFLVFSDYMRPAIRLAALMQLGVIFVFTHDSIGVGEDGPTHQPVEHLASLRIIPNLLVIRPCDANETAVAWRVAMETRNRPVALILTRQDVSTLDRSRYASAEGLRRGGYVLSDTPAKKLDVILIATGSEVGLIVAAQQKLAEQGIGARTVSLPSWELFEAQPQNYREAVLPPSLRARLAVEAGSAQGWCRYVGDSGDVIGIDHFGASAPGKVLFERFGYTVDNIVARASRLAKQG